MAGSDDLMFFLLRSQFSTAAPLVAADFVPGHRVWGVVYDTNGTTRLGALVNILSASTQREINKAGTFEVTIPATDAGASLLVAGRELDLYYEGHGVRFRGVIEQLTWVINEDGRKDLRCTGLSLAAELVYQNTYISVDVEDLAQAAALEAVLDNADNTWNDLITGSYVNISDRYTNMTLFEAALKLGERSKGYIRETNTARVLELKNTHTASGIVVANLEAAGPVLGSSSKIAPVSSVPRMERDGAGLINRVVAYGHGEDRELFDLRQSTRSSPYTRQSFIQRPSSITNVVVYPYTATYAVDEREAFDVEIGGSNRGLILVFAIDNNDGVGRPIKVSINGRELGTAQNVVPGVAADARMYVYTFVAPARGRNTVSWEHIATAAGDDAVAVAIVLDNVWQGDGNDFLRADNEAVGTSTAPSVAVTSLAQDLVVDLMIDNNAGAGTATPGAGQTLVSQTNNVGSDRVSVSKEIATGASTTMSWTLNASRPWVITAMSVKPALVYYIEDSSSVSSYRRRVKVLPDVDLSSFGELSIVNAANTLYDYAVDFLLKHKDPVDVHEVAVASLPDTEGDAMLPGDSVRYLFRGVVEDSDGKRLYLDIDDQLIVTAISESWGEDGVRRWGLTLATAVRELGDAAVLGAALGKVARLGNAQAVS